MNTNVDKVVERKQLLKILLLVTFCQWQCFVRAKDENLNFVEDLVGSVKALPKLVVT